MVAGIAAYESMRPQGPDITRLCAGRAFGDLGQTVVCRIPILDRRQPGDEAVDLGDREPDRIKL
jgi:hypothetical protein